MNRINFIWLEYEKLIRLVLRYAASLFGKTLSESIVNRIVQFAKFCLVGVLNAAISLAVYYMVILVLGKPFYIVGNLAGFLISVLNSWFWNSRFVFLVSRKGTLIRTLCSYTFSLLLGTVLLYLMVDVLEFSAFAAPIVNIVITTPVNYIINKSWAYRNTDNEINRTRLHEEARVDARGE